MNIRKILAVLFVLLLGFVLIACNNNKVEEKEKYKITFFDETGNVLKEQEYEKDKLPSFTYSPKDTDTHYVEFVGWAVSLGGEVVEIKKVVADATYYAVVKKTLKDVVDPFVEYTVTFDSDGGTPVASVKVKAGELVADPGSITKAGYEFLGWYLENNYYDFLSQVTKDITLKAKWEEIVVQKHVVTFDSDGGTLVDPVSVEVGSTVANPGEITKDGYVFLGWYLFGGLFDFNLPIIMDTTLVAMWEEIVVGPVSYTVTFVTNGGSNVTNITVEEGTTITEPEKPSKDDHKFVAWAYDVELSEKVTWPLEVNKDITLYAAWNEIVDLKGFFNELLNDFKKSPYDYIPESIMPENYLVSNPILIKYKEDYLTNVNLNQINYLTVGEQWNMVLDNLEQSKIFYQVLGGIEGLSSSVVVAFNNYLDSNPEDENNFEFTQGIYTVNINYENGVLSYDVKYSMNIPLLGEQSIIINAKYNIAEKKKIVRIELGAPNVVKYEISENEYKFAIKYAGVRRAYFNIKEEDGVVKGDIFEFITLLGFDYKSAAQFVINSNHLLVVGNKAAGLTGFTGTINEIYDINIGKLIGCGFEEKLSIAEPFNNVIFHLDNFSGINVIKYAPSENEGDYTIYVNDFEFHSKKFGGINLKTASRRYYIEFRTQFIYIETEGKLEKVEIQVPMMRIQQEKYEEFVADVRSENSFLSNFENNIPAPTYQLIKNSYDTNIPIFKDNKDNFSSEDIVNYIG